MDIIQYNVSENIALIKLNRPDKRNALSPELIAALKDAFQRAENDDDVSAVILQANGEAFCAGADLSYLQKLQNFSYEENLADSMSLKDLFWQIYSFRKIVIAKVNGAALAGGFGLASVCDLCFSSEDATFGYTEVKIGFVPALVMVFMLRKVGDAKARQLLLTGNIFSAKEIQASGLVYKIFSKDQLDTEVMKFTKDLIHSNSRHAMMLTKKTITELESPSLNEALYKAAVVNAQARSSDDCKKGIAAFLSKQKIDWNS